MSVRTHLPPRSARVYYTVGPPTAETKEAFFSKLHVLKRRVDKFLEQKIESSEKDINKELQDSIIAVFEELKIKNKLDLILEACKRDGFDMEEAHSWYEELETIKNAINSKSNEPYYDNISRFGVYFDEVMNTLQPRTEEEIEEEEGSSDEESEPASTVKDVEETSGDESDGSSSIHSVPDTVSKDALCATLTMFKDAWLEGLKQAKLYQNQYFQGNKAVKEHMSKATAAMDALDVQGTLADLISFCDKKGDISIDEEGKKTFQEAFNQMDQKVHDLTTSGPEAGRIKNELSTLVNALTTHLRALLDPNNSEITHKGDVMDLAKIVHILSDKTEFKWPNYNRAEKVTNAIINTISKYKYEIASIMFAIMVGLTIWLLCMPKHTEEIDQNDVLIQYVLENAEKAPECVNQKVLELLTNVLDQSGFNRATERWLHTWRSKPKCKNEIAKFIDEGKTKFNYTGTLTIPQQTPEPRDGKMKFHFEAQPRHAGDEVSMGLAIGLFAIGLRGAYALGGLVVAAANKRRKTNDNAIESSNANEGTALAVLPAPLAPALMPPAPALMPPAPTGTPEISLEDMKKTVTSEFDKPNGFTVFEVLVDPLFIQIEPEDKQKMPTDAEGNIIIRIRRTTSTFLQNQRVNSNFNTYYEFYTTKATARILFDDWATLGEKNSDGTYTYFKGVLKKIPPNNKRPRGMGARLASAAPAVKPHASAPRLPTPYVLYL